MEKITCQNCLSKEKCSRYSNGVTCDEWEGDCEICGVSLLHQVTFDDLMRG